MYCASCTTMVKTTPDSPRASRMNVMRVMELNSANLIIYERRYSNAGTALAFARRREKRESVF